MIYHAEAAGEIPLQKSKPGLRRRGTGVSGAQYELTPDGNGSHWVLHSHLSGSECDNLSTNIHILRRRARLSKLRVGRRESVWSRGSQCKQLGEPELKSFPRDSLQRPGAQTTADATETQRR
ncbi:unnamed protein product [Leuciscus chuanchicus]